MQLSVLRTSLRSPCGNIGPIRVSGRMLLPPSWRGWMRALLIFAAVAGPTNPLPAQDAAQPANQSDATASLERSNLRPLNEIDLNAALVHGRAPVDYAAQSQDRPLTVGVSRPWYPVNHRWKATGLCYRPLYFEHVGMERYGQTCCACTAPLVAGAHFYSSIAILPYKMTIEPPCQPTYALGYYRPGSPAPCVACTIPFDPWALTVQTMAVSGLVLLIP